MISTPVPEPLHPDPVQSFFALFTYILGLGSCFATIWLGLYAQRHDLHIMATTDGLSGLLNRRAFDDLLHRELQPGDRRNEPIALLLIDLDHFKAINDDHGHQMGDEVIRRVSQLLCINTREIDAVARYGGEEFAMMLKGMNLEQAESIAERLRTQIEAMAGLPEPIRVTASIGIAMKDADDTIASLLKRSDEALYLSKRAGRNRVSTHFAYAEY
jgi:diguanylate cyclase (GGDEF)-like protein